MKFTCLLLFLITFFVSCKSPNNKIEELEADKNILQLRVDSLQSEIAELTRPPGDIINDVKNNIRQGDMANAKKSLATFTSHQLSAHQLNEINSLLSAVNNKQEQNDFQNLSASDTSLYSSFIKNYPKSKYSEQVRKRLKKLRQVQVTRTYYPKKHISKSYGTTRVGAICCDGSESSATGRGACSHHGGVCKWLYR